MELHGGNIYDKEVKLDFSISINPFGMPKRVQKAAIKGVMDSEQYPDINQRKLLDALEEFHNIEKTEFVLGNGAAELIYGLVQSIRPKNALILGPTFVEYERALEAFDCKYQYYLAIEEDEYQFTNGVLEELKKEYDMVFLCNPNNPTGKLIDVDLLEKIVEISIQNKSLLIVDECFMDFVSDEKHHTLLKGERAEQIVVLRAFTKIFGIPGLRLGYAISKNKKVMQDLKQILSPWNVSIPAQYAGVAATKEKDFVENTKKEVVLERKWMKEQLEELGFQVLSSDVNFVLFKGKSGLQKALLKKGMLIRDGGSFRGLGDGYYRIGLKQRMENKQFICALFEVIKEEPWQNQS